MNKCINCQGDILQIEGKKTKIYCSDRCRIAFKRSNPNKSEQVLIKSEQKQTKSEQIQAKSEQVNDKSEQNKIWTDESIRENPTAEMVRGWYDLTSKGLVREDDVRFQPFLPAWVDAGSKQFKKQ